MPERIELITGAAAWLRVLQAVTAISAFCFLLAAPSPWSWRLAAIAVLGVFAAFQAWRQFHHRTCGRLVLHLDGSVLNRLADTEIDGVLDGGAWVSRWFCVVCWKPLEGGARRHSLVCAELNQNSEYRRLMVWMRLGVGRAEEAPSW